MEIKKAWLQKNHFPPKSRIHNGFGLLKISSGWIEYSLIKLYTKLFLEKFEKSSWTLFFDKIDSLLEEKNDTYLILNFIFYFLLISSCWNHHCEYVPEGLFSRKMFDKVNFFIELLAFFQTRNMSNIFQKLESKTISIKYLLRTVSSMIL